MKQILTIFSLAIGLSLLAAEPQNGLTQKDLKNTWSGNRLTYDNEVTDTLSVKATRAEGEGPVIINHPGRLTVTPGENYKVSFEFRGNTQMVLIGYAYTDEKAQGKRFDIIGVQKFSDEFTEYQKEFKIPDGAKFISVVFYGMPGQDNYIEIRKFESTQL